MRNNHRKHEETDTPRVSHTDRSGPSGAAPGTPYLDTRHTPKPQQPQGAEKSTRHTHRKCSTPLAAERSLRAAEGASVIIRNPSQPITFLFLSEQHPDTGVTDSSRAATHLTTGLEGACMHRTSRLLMGPEEKTKGAMLRGERGALQMPACAPAPRTQQHPKPHSPLPFCLMCAKAGHLLCFGVFHELTQVLPAAHIHLTTATTAKQVGLSPCLRI